MIYFSNGKKKRKQIDFLKQQGFSDSDIQKVTGHASIAMVNAYDKSSRADNPTRKICLVA